MRNRLDLLVRYAARAAALLLVAPALLAGAGVAAAGQGDVTAQAEPDVMTFGLLGPVGLAAVALGVVGMAAGIVRQRRRAQEAQDGPEPAADLPDEPTRPALTPYRRPPA